MRSGRFGGDCVATAARGGDDRGVGLLAPEAGSGRGHGRDRHRGPGGVGPRCVDLGDRGSLEAQAGLVQYECVGVRGMLNELMRRAPRGGRITVVGVCMEPDTITPIFGINKELQLQFVLGYTPDEFRDSLHHLAEGRIDGGPLITGRVPLDGVAQAFVDLANPEAHAKIIVTP